MIIKSANLMALSALLAPEESLMEKEAMAVGRVARKFMPKAKHVRKQVMRQPAVQAHNARRGAEEVAQQAKQRLRPGANQNPFNTQGNSFSGGTAGGTMQWNMPQPGPSFSRGMSQVGQGFGEMGSAIMQGGRNAINRGLQAGANAANAAKRGLQATGNAITGGARAAGNAIAGGAKATGNAIMSGARAAKRGLQATGNAIAGGARAAGNAVMKGGKNTLEWAQKNPALALGGGYVLYDQLTDN